MIDNEKKQKLIELGVKYSERISNIKLKSKNGKGTMNDAYLSKHLADKFLVELIGESGVIVEDVSGDTSKAIEKSYVERFIDFITECLTDDEILILRSKATLEWADSIFYDEFYWERNMVYESWDNFIDNLVNVISIESNIKLTIGEESEYLDFSTEEGAKTIEEIQSLLIKELKNYQNEQDEKADELRVELVRMKELINKIDIKTNEISKDIFQSEFQSILDSVASISGPLGSMIMTVIKTAKLANKRIKMSRKPKLIEMKGD